MKEEVIDLLYSFRDDIQEMRENSETDLRSVIWRLESVIEDIKSFEE